MNIDKVAKIIFKLGYLPALITLKELEEAEQYEACHVLKSAMDQLTIHNGFSTSVDRENMKHVADDVLGEFKDRELILHNMAHYIIEFKNEFKNLPS